MDFAYAVLNNLLWNLKKHSAENLWEISVSKIISSFNTNKNLQYEKF